MLLTIVSSEHGLATHYIPSARVPMLLGTLAALEKPTYAQVNEVIEDLYYDRQPTDPVAPLSGAVRLALDSAFSQETVEGIISTLETFITEDARADVVQWAKDTLAILEERSPTSLKLTLTAIRKGKLLDLLECLKMELGISAAFCVSFMVNSFLYSQMTICFLAWRFSRYSYRSLLCASRKETRSPGLVTGFSRPSKCG
jgi:enoyl-CoA hydratase/carnithine racemase